MTAGPARQSSMNRPVMASNIGRFAREKQRILDRFCQFTLSTIGADGSVAVGTARIRVGLPIVKISVHKFLCETIEANT